MPFPWQSVGGARPARALPQIGHSAACLSISTINPSYADDGGEDLEWDGILPPSPRSGAPPAMKSRNNDNVGSGGVGIRAGDGSGRTHRTRFGTSQNRSSSPYQQRKGGIMRREVPEVGTMAPAEEQGGQDVS